MNFELMVLFLDTDNDAQMVLFHKRLMVHQFCQTYLFVPFFNMNINGNVHVYIYM